MEVIFINEQKLKVMLSQSDLSQYEITAKELDGDSGESVRALRHILECAKEKTGFDTAKSRLFVQAYSDKTGGCELYVTKLSKGGAEAGVFLGKEEIKTVCNVYLFDTLEGLLQACLRLKQQGYADDSRAYAEQDSQNTYLLIRDASVDSHAKLRYAYPVVSDYGVRKTHVGILSYLSEHCDVLCEHRAVETLAPFAKKTPTRKQVGENNKNRK